MGAIRLLAGHALAISERCPVDQWSLLPESRGPRGEEERRPLRIASSSCRTVMGRKGVEP